MPRDIDTATQPHAIMCKNIIHELAQMSESARPTNQPIVQRDLHHSRALVALLIEHIEGVS